MSALVRSTAALGGTPDASWSKRPGRAYRRVEPQLVAALEPELVAALTDAQSSRAALKGLRWSHSPRGGAALELIAGEHSTGMENAPGWQRLDMKDVDSLAGALTCGPRAETWLQRLSLFGCEMTVDGLHVLAPQMARCARLTQLDLRNCGLREAGAVVLAAAIERLPALSSLYLSGNPLGPGGISAVCQALERSSVTELYLNGVQKEKADEPGGIIGVAAIAKLMQRLPRLRVLSLHDNQIGPVGAKLLGDALPHSQLSRLSLCCNPLGRAGGEALAAACSKSQLVQMDLPMTLPHELLMDVRASVERTRRGGALVAAMQRLALAKLTSERMSSLSDSAGYLLEVPQDLMEAIGSLAGWPAERVMRRFARSRRQRCELALEKAMRQAASIGATEAACASGDRMAGVKPELERQWNDHNKFLVAV